MDEFPSEGAGQWKSMEITAEQLGDLQQVAAQLFSEPEDPRSSGYKRILIRPSVNWLRILLNCLLPAAAAAGLFVLLYRLHAGWGAALAVSLGALLLYVSLRAKAILICCVRLYQRYAPAAIRNKCRFEPSCSQYMILCLQKYGAAKGLIKGIRRLRRCNINDGGYDFP